MALFLSAILFCQLLGDKFLRGADAYYYALQALSWFQTGQVRIPDSNIIHRIVGLIQYFGFTAETSLKIWVSFSYFLFLLSFLFVLKNLKSNCLMLLLFAWAALSPSILFIGIELPKTFLFLTAFTLAFSELLKDKINYPVLAIALCIGLLIHKMALVYIGVIILYLLLSRYISVKKILYLVFGGILFALVYNFIIIDHFQLLDIFRLKSANIMPGIISVLLNNSFALPIKIEIILSVLLIILLVHQNKKNTKVLFLPVFLLATTFFPTLGAETLSAGERFGILFPYLALLSATYILKGYYLQKFSYKFYWLCLIILFVGLFHLKYSYSYVRNNEYKQYDELISAMADKEIPMLIVHKRFHYYYKYKTGLEAFSYEPESHWNKKRIWRLVYGVTPAETFFYKPDTCAWNKDIYLFPEFLYMLMREDCYFEMRKAVNQEQNPELYDLLHKNGINPFAHRPAFLYKKHKHDANTEFPASI